MTNNINHFFLKYIECKEVNTFKMTWINEKLICSLESNSKSLYIGGISILLRLLDNIIREPENVKYRKIKLDNKIVKEKLLPINGICEVLEDIGFVQVGIICCYIIPQYVLFSQIVFEKT